MKLVFLGTSAAQPTTKRGLTCVCLIFDGEILMFDVGEGTQISYLKSGLGWNKKMKIFVTHMHGDHCTGILGLLQTMTLQKRTELIEIYGPKGIEDFISINIKTLNFGTSFPVIITTIDKGVIVDKAKYTVSACNAEHTISAFSYCFIEKNKPGRFFPEKAVELGIPKGVLWNKLQNGHTINVDNRIILPSQVLGQSRKGKKIGISGDTRPARRLIEFFMYCDYLVFDSTFADELKEKARETCHSTSVEAATFAKNANVKNLILTHFSARYNNDTILRKEAEKIHDSVIAARDFLEVEIK